MSSPPQRSRNRGPARPGGRGGAARPSPGWRAQLWPLAWKLALAGGVLALIGVVYLDAYIQRAFSGKKWAVPAVVFARPLELYTGAALSPQAVIEELKTLGYREAATGTRPGSYAFADGLLSIGTRGFQFWDGEEPPRQMHIRFAGNRIARLYDQQAEELPIARLEPVHIGGIYPAHNEDRILVRAQDVSPLLVQTLMAVEDRNFMRHHGVSIKGIARALWVDVTSGELQQGGSTLTQQLVKNFFLTPERSIKRKLMELAMAIVMEFRYSKEEILEGYLNEIYLGQDGHRAIHGFGLAAQYYFNRPVNELDVQQIALLVGMVRGPSYYDPWRNPERAKARRDQVIGDLVETGALKPEAAQALTSRPLDMGDREDSRSRYYPAYLEFVRRQLKQDYSDEDLSSEGLRIFTGLDPQVQRAAERALQENLARIEKESAARGKPQKALEGAVVVTRVNSGEVLAVVGGRYSRIAGFNRAIDAVRPIGSLMKPAVYLTALASGRYTLLSPLDDGPVFHKGANGKVWHPLNYDRKDHGQVRLHAALANSYNQSTARLGLEIGVPRVVDTIHRLGIERPVAALPSVLLGAVALSPLEVAGMYQTIASGGFSTPLRAIREVMASDGMPLSRYSVAVEQKVGADAIFLLQYALQEVVTGGTARAAARRLPAGLTVAGKTGTTDDQRDSWFAGYAGDLLAVVWVGRDDNGTTSLTGATGALPVWTDLMAASSREPLQAAAPDRVVEEWVDAWGGGLSAPGCPGARLMPFLAGTQPQYADDCRGSWQQPAPRAGDAPEAEGDSRPAQPAQQPKKKSWWKRWFGE